MRKLTIVAGIVALLGIGVAAGFALDSESTPEPAQTTIVVQQPTGISEPAPVLNAINLMKPGFNGRTSDEARQTHAQLVSAGYSYWTTYPDGTERINYSFTEKGKTKSVEFVVSPNGVHMDASVYGLSTEDWGVWCSAPIGRSPVDAMNALMAKTHSAASKLDADPSCKYQRFN